ncbi:hypothetical protein ANN_25695 [Periplaneta americana]|uniref:Zinc finger MYND domain-containing protein 10 n=1 Tax=Periplaneta americana TaxID=6978 RepID=A0ABQ8S484_PERAM|nr:hypothetical protein ANN_25695 [Periplaneta americana]
MTETIIKDVLTVEEIAFYVKTIEPSDIVELGSSSWFESHERLQKLHQQAILEARELREENVKDTIILYNKIPVLLHEAVCISVWKEKVLPLLVKTVSEPESVFIPYMVLFHEATAIEFLQTLLYHSDSCEALGENAIELIDYCASAITRIIAEGKQEVSKSSETLSGFEDLEHKQRTITFNIGMKCISVIGCMTQNIDSLPLSATSRMFSTHDIPILLANIIELQPWIKKDSSGKTLKYDDCNWEEMKGEAKMKVTRTEAKTWLALRHLLLDPRLPAHYDINEYRKSQLTKLQCFLQESILDQLPPLVELKYWLAKLAVANFPPASKQPLILEVTPQIRQILIQRNSKRWKKIAKKQAEVMFNKSEDHIMGIIKSLNEAYNLDTLEALAVGPPTCTACGEHASKKCSRCKAPYCGRYRFINV